MAATDFVTEAAIDSLTTTIATAVKSNTTAIGTKTDDTAVTAHVSNTTGAHAATAVSFAHASYTADNVHTALVEVRSVAESAAGGGVSINDASVNTTDAWSGQKITDELVDAITQLIDGSPEALDTLAELSAALGDDPDFAATITTALGYRLRFDAPQTLTSPQREQALANLGVVASNVDFAAAFTTAIA